MTDLFELFRSLPVPEGTEEKARVFSSIATDKAHGFRVAKSSEGYAFLILPCPNESRVAPGVRLEKLVVERRVVCRISDSDGTVSTGEFSLIGCTAVDAELQSFFLRIISPFVDTVDFSNAGSANRAIDLLVALFRAIERPARKTIQGLWAELFLISEASNSADLIDAWHSEPTDLFDFSSGVERVEVKSSSDRRAHHFRLEQLAQPEGTRLVVASFIVRSAGAGTSIGDLVERLSHRPGMDGTRLEKVAKNTAETLGADWRSGVSQRFDEEWARDNLLFFDARAIPKVPGPIPPEVENVRFVVDCSSLQPAPEASWREMVLLSRIGFKESDRR